MSTFVHHNLTHYIIVLSYIRLITMVMRYFSTVSSCTFLRVPHLACQTTVFPKECVHTLEFLTLHANNSFSKRVCAQTSLPRVHLIQKMRTIDMPRRALATGRGSGQLLISIDPGVMAPGRLISLQEELRCKSIYTYILRDTFI